VVETGLKPVSTHVINYGSPKSVTKIRYFRLMTKFCEALIWVCLQYSIAKDTS